ncbi:MAG TPA: SCP2 sterol-binding domain-containing protein [Acidimicrobiales bacterium]|nr:SCP2 sterol-binding domain-containing protein [Acidimicrobiales bacterium]
MAAYLSPAWFDDLDRTARAADGLGPVTAGAQVVIQQVVTGLPDGDVRYWIRVDDGAIQVGRGDAERPDATVTQSYATAVAVSRGELAVEDAILAGRAKLAGDIGVLVRHQAALQGVAAALAAVRERTTYD